MCAIRPSNTVGWCCDVVRCDDMACSVVIDIFAMGCSTVCVRVSPVIMNNDSMLEEMNKMNDENTSLREEKKNLAARFRQKQQQQLQDAQTVAQTRHTATRYVWYV